MKLLSPAETKDKRENFNAALSSKSATLDEAIVAKRKELLDMDEQFLLAMQNQRLARMEEEEVWRKSNQELRTKTEELENRKRLALVPLADKEKELETREEVLLQREQNVSEHESEVENNLTLVEMRLDEASERLASVRAEERRLDKRRNGIELQEKQTTDRTNQFNELLAKSYTILNQAKENIAQREAEQNGRDIALSEKQIRLVSQEKDLVARETRLLDRTLTLERAVQEMKDKKLL